MLLYILWQCGLVLSTFINIPMSALAYMRFILKDKEFYKADSPEYFKNILIMYFNNMEFDEKTLEVYEDFDFTNTPANEMYYYIPAAIYIFERTITDKMKKLAD